MNMKHVTLATVGAVLTVAGTGYGLYSAVSKDIKESRDAQVQKALTYERRYEYLNGRLDQLETAVRALASAQPRQQRLLEQILAVKRQAQAYNGIVALQRQRISSDDVSAEYDRTVLREAAHATLPIGGTDVPLPAKPVEKPQ